jgi:hypothetical protein
MTRGCKDDPYGLLFLRGALSSRWLSPPNGYRRDFSSFFMSSSSCSGFGPATSMDCPVQTHTPVVWDWVGLNRKNTGLSRQDGNVSYCEHDGAIHKWPLSNTDADAGCMKCDRSYSQTVLPFYKFCQAHFLQFSHRYQQG